MILYSKIREALALLGVDDPKTVRGIYIDAHKVTITYITGQTAQLGERGGLLLEEDTRHIDYRKPKESE